MSNVVTVYSQNNIAVFAAGIQGAAGVGVPAGGAGGQVLSKIDGSDYHTQWVTQASGVPAGSVTGLAAVATSGSYNDLSNKPTIPTLPTLAAVATTGAYASLTGTPTLGTLASQNGTFSGSSSGTNTGDQTITLSGDITGSGTGAIAATVSNSAVIGKVLTGYVSGAGTVAATDSILQAIQKLNGNDGLRAPIANPTFTGTVSGITAAMVGAPSGSGTHSGSSSGTNTGDQTITLSGDITGSGTGSFAATIAANAVTNAKHATMATGTIKGNYSGVTANPSDLTPAQVRGMLAVKPALQMVATRCGLNHAGGAQFSTAQPGCITRMQHYLPYGAKSLYPIYSAFYVTTTNPDTETASPGGYGFYATAATVVAGGSGYAVGDRVTVSGVATNQFAPTLQVDAVSSGAVTALSVVDGGGFGSAPSTGLATTKITGAGTGLTVTLTMADCAFVMQAAVEQTWNTQTALSATNTGGVMKLTAGANAAMGVGNIVVPYTEAVKCDALQVGLAAGSSIATRLYTPGTGFYVGRYLSGTSGLSEAGHSSIAIASAAPYGGAFPTYAAPAPGFQPIAIMGIPQVPGPSFALIGDSLGFGTVSASGATSHDTLDANGNGGYLERAINQTAPFSNFCTPSDRLANWLSQTGAPIRLRLLQQLNVSHVVDQMGINDLYAGGTSYTTFKAMKIKFWQMLMGLGIKEIWATTITPNTTSTDNWATTTNQTVTSANSAIQAFNSDLRSGVFSSYVARVLDLGTAAESSLGSGLWPANGSGDGLHPTQAQTATLASQIASAFTLATL